MASTRVRNLLLQPVLFASFAALAACSPKQPQPGQTALPAGVTVTVASNNQLSASNAAVFGRIIDTDWYIVVTGAAGVKPLVIWTESKADCDGKVAEFSVKSVDPSRPDEPAKAWCVLGQELRTKYNIRGA